RRRGVAPAGAVLTNLRLPGSLDAGGGMSANPESAASIEKVRGKNSELADALDQLDTELLRYVGLFSTLSQGSIDYPNDTNRHLAKAAGLAANVKTIQQELEEQIAENAALLKTGDEMLSIAAGSVIAITGTGVGVKTGTITDSTATALVGFFSAI